jgi:hypothetical protein
MMNGWGKMGSVPFKAMRVHRPLEVKVSLLVLLRLRRGRLCSELQCSRGGCTGEWRNGMTRLAGRVTALTEFSFEDAHGGTNQQNRQKLADGADE